MTLHQRLDHMMQSSAIREVRRGTFANVLFKVLGSRFAGIGLTEAGVVLLAGTPKEIAFSEMAGPVHVERGLWFDAIAVPLASGARLRVAGLQRASTARFVETATEAWRQFILAQFNEAAEELQALAKVVERLRQPRRYPSACLLEPFFKRVEAITSWLPTTIPEEAIPEPQRQMLKAVVGFKRAPEGTRNEAIKKFIDGELREVKDFFDTIESNPLTPEQRLAVVTDEDATLVLAGAGSGKTSVIVAKAAYLIQRSIRQPEEILLLAFGKDAAEEMATRIEQRSGSLVDALTFHALGYGIIRELEGHAPALAPHASDDAQLRTLLRDILLNEIATQKHLYALLLKWFAEIYVPYKSEWDFKTKDEYYHYVEAHELRTLKGEIVRSFEESEIANWLFLNGIAYEYEPVYEHELPENDRRVYTPDFRLTESGVYIEHFGVRKARGPDGATRLTTAPYVDRESYLEGMEWKRTVHRDHGTTLIETYSYERVEGGLTEALAEKLAPYVSLNPMPSEQVFETLAEMGQVDAFTQTFGTFLRHFKSTGSTIEQCRKRAKASSDPARGIAFLEIFAPTFEAYQHRLGERIDFEDMIVRATEHVQAGRFRSPYRHLLIDEFQDISVGRARLLLALKAQHPDVRIFAVGDDWQSIYRFSGSDIHLMRDFGREFGGTLADSTGIHRTVDLGRTFRSVDKIASPARRFVLKNPSQIKKQVIAAGAADAPAIKVSYYSRGQAGTALRAALGAIQESAPSDRKTSVLLLGRYHFVRPDDIVERSSSYPSLSIRFMSVHGSKGLEADHVVILRANSGHMGFPSEIVDDPLLDLVLPEPERFDHAEERRLFYVALTRARKSVTILADSEKPSVFVEELVDGDEYQTVESGKPEVAQHRCGACGGRMLAKTSMNGGMRFECEHRFLCGETLRPCNACGSDLPVQDSADPQSLICSCGARFPVCPECKDGWLVERKGRYGRFLGCVRYPSCGGSKRLSQTSSARGQVAGPTDTD